MLVWALIFSCFSSIMNWIEDLYWKQLDLNYPGISDAMVRVCMVQFSLHFGHSEDLFLMPLPFFQVHHGFYYAYHNTTMRPEVLSSIERAKKLYGDLKIMVTGHSMGGAMASFCGLDLTVILGSFLEPMQYIYWAL